MEFKKLLAKLMIYIHLKQSGEFRRRIMSSSNAINNIDSLMKNFNFLEDVKENFFFG